MAEWNKVKLGEIAFITSSKRIFAKEYQTEGIPFYRGKEIIEKHNGNDVSTELYITRERYEEIKAKFDVPHPGDILLSSVGTLGVSWLVDEEEFYFKDGNLTWLRCNDKTTPEFLYLWLNSPEAQNQIDSMCIGSTQKALTIETLNKFDVTLPPLDVQKKICEMIYPVSDKIKTNTAINRNLEEQVASLYKSWFIDFDLNGGVCPNDWEEAILGDIADIGSGKRPPIKQNEKTKDICVPLVGAASIMGYTNEALYDSKILVTGRVGTHGVVQRFNERCWPSDNTLVITTSRYEFVNQILLNIDYKSMNRGSTQPLITQSDLKKIEIIMPTSEILDEFEKLAGGLMSNVEKNIKENVKLAEIRDALLPKLMSGELDVSDLEI